MKRLGYQYQICDMIKKTESDARDIVLEILPKTVFKFFCFIFRMYLGYKISNFNEVCIKMKHLEDMRKCRKKLSDSLPSLYLVT